MEDNDAFPHDQTTKEERLEAELENTTVITYPRTLPDNVVVRVSDAFPNHVVIYKGGRVKKIKII